MASCPHCGFDLGESGICPVCGFGTEAAPQPVKRREPRRSALRIWIGAAVLVAAAGAVLAVVLSAHRGPEIADAPSSAARAPSAAVPALPARDEAAATAALPAERAVASADAPDNRNAQAASAPVERPAASDAGRPAPTDATAPVDGDDPNMADRTALPPIDSKQDYVSWMLAHTGEKEPYVGDKWDRAQAALGRGDIKNRRVLFGFLLTPREEFVRSYNLPRAYADAAIPIGYGQTISGPHIVARMTDAINPLPGMKVLEIGTGSGYQSAFLSELSRNVYTIEIVKPLADETNAIYAALSARYPMYANIHRRAADGYYGWPEAAPFDRIIVTCAIDHIPPDLLKQLAPGGIMVIPVGPPSGQVVLSITKIVDPDGTVRLEREDIYHGSAKKIFVPFTASGGGVHSLATDQAGGQ